LTSHYHIDKLFYYLGDTLSHIMTLKSKTKILEEQEKYSRYLEKNGLRFSKGRLRVFEMVMSAHGHFAPEEILKISEDKYVNVSRATIYRSIHELLESGVIRLTAFGEKHQHFEHLYDEKPHHHARCIKCGVMIEFPDRNEDAVYRPTLEHQGFHILGHEMHFYGFCSKCYSHNTKRS